MSGRPIEVLVLAMGLLAAQVVQAAGPAPAGSDSAGADTTRPRTPKWLHHLWRQADTLARRQDFPRGSTVTAAGVRGLVAGAIPGDSTGLSRAPGDSLGRSRAAADEEWLKTVWGQIDTLVQQVDFPAQTTVTAGGVRGAEADDAVVGRYYYFKGGRYYANEELVEQVVATLQQKLARRPGRAEAARLQYLEALCHDILGQRDQAAAQYTAVVAHHAKSPYAPWARQRLQQLATDPSLGRASPGGPRP